MLLFAIWNKIEGWMDRSEVFIELKEQRSRNIVSGQEVPSAFGVSGVGSVNRKNTINCHQFGLQNRHRWSGPLSGSCSIIVALVVGLSREISAVSG